MDGDMMVYDFFALPMHTTLDYTNHPVCKDYLNLKTPLLCRKSNPQSIYSPLNSANRLSLHVFRSALKHSALS